MGRETDHHDLTALGAVHDSMAMSAKQMRQMLNPEWIKSETRMGENVEAAAK
jgi:hypothetical protein